MAISRYAPQGQPHGQAKGSVRLIKDLEETVDGQHVIFVEDVIDTGLTLNYLLRILKTRSPASLEVCALFDKKEHRLVNTPVKYIGFDLPFAFRRRIWAGLPRGVSASTVCGRTAPSANLT